MARSDWRRPSEEKFAVPAGMRRIVIEVSYNGNGFCGWQMQNGQRTVQEVLQNSVSTLCGFPVVISGSGRTDSGVHALSQVCHFDVPETCTLPPRAFEHCLVLPDDIKVSKCYDAPPLFHSRFSTMAREYRYLIRSSSDVSCFENGLVATVRSLPSLELLNSYASLIEGTHDFSTFTGAGDLSESHFRDIYLSSFHMEESIYGGPVLVYRICGNAFLYHMVRSLVGTMLSLAQTMTQSSEFARILESKDRSQALLTAKPEGLYLWRISYDPEEFRWFEEEKR